MGKRVLINKMSEKYDLHTHLYTNWRKGKFSLEQRQRTIQHILDTIRKAKLNGIVLTNFGDSGDWVYAYEELTESAKDKTKLGKYSLVKELKNALIFEDEKGLLSIIKGQEIPTSEGAHIMAIGLNYRETVPSRLNLKSGLEKIKDFGAIVNADHYNGFLGIGKENLKKYKNLIDVFEGKNQNYEQSLLKFKLGLNPSIIEADKLTEQLGINWIAVSDCHNSKDLGNGHIEINGTLDFSSEDNLRESLRDKLRKKEFKPIIRKKNPLTSVAGHIIICLYDIHIRNKLGLINLENP